VGKVISIVTMVAATDLLLVAAPSQAVVKWTFTSGNCVGPCSGTGRTFDTSSETNGDVGNNAAVTGWGATELGGTNNLLNEGTLNQFNGGLGVTNADDVYEDDSNTPGHAMDNKQRLDAMLFDFGGQQISLDDISIGYFSGDADVSVLAYTGATTDSNQLKTEMQSLVYGGVAGTSSATMTSTPQKVTAFIVRPLTPTSHQATGWLALITPSLACARIHLAIPILAAYPITITSN
jgi:hypothetical protein